MNCEKDMEQNETFAEFTNGSLSPEEVQVDASAFRVTKIFFYFLILFVSTFGNSMVAHIIRNTKKMRTASNYLILNLAICDLVTPLISIVFDFILEENDYVWFYGGVMCKLLWPAQTYFTCASSLNLAAISLDRYRLIMHPFKTRLSTKQIYFMILLVHVFSLAAVGPYVYVLSLHNGTCEEHWPKFAYRQAYTLFLFLMQYGFPLTFMAVVYGLAVHALYNTSARISRNSINSNVCQTRLKVTGVSQNLKKPGRKISRTESVMKKIHSMRRKIDIWSTPNAKAMKMFIMIVVVFAIFMFPNQVVWLWADFGGGINSPHFTKISIICWLFTYTNSVVNPIIFGVFTKDFRRGFKKIFNSIIPCFNTSLELGVSRDAKRFDCSYNKTASETLLNVETVGINSQRNSSFLTPQNTQDEPSRWSRTCLVKSFSEQDLDKAIKSTSKTFKLEGKLECLNYDHLTVTSGEHSVILPDLFSYGHPKDALNNLRETDC